MKGWDDFDLLAMFICALAMLLITTSYFNMRTLGKKIDHLTELVDSGYTEIVK